MWWSHQGKAASYVGAIASVFGVLPLASFQPELKNRSIVSGVGSIQFSPAVWTITVSGNGWLISKVLGVFVPASISITFSCSFCYTIIFLHWGPAVVPWRPPLWMSHQWLREGSWSEFVVCISGRRLDLRMIFLDHGWPVTNSWAEVVNLRNRLLKPLP